MPTVGCQNLELVQHVMVDGGYTGNDFADQLKLILTAKKVDGIGDTLQQKLHG